MDRTAIGHEGMGYLLYALSKQPHLREVSLDENVDGNDQVAGRYEVAEGLGDMVDSCPDLEYLSVRGNAQKGWRVNCEQLLKKATASSIRHLDITGNNIGASDVGLKNLR